MLQTKKLIYFLFIFFIFSNPEKKWKNDKTTEQCSQNPMKELHSTTRHQGSCHREAGFFRVSESYKQIGERKHGTENEQNKKKREKEEKTRGKMKRKEYL